LESSENILKSVKIIGFKKYETISLIYKTKDIKSKLITIVL